MNSFENIKTAVCLLLTLFTAILYGSHQSPAKKDTRAAFTALRATYGSQVVEYQGPPGKRGRRLCGLVNHSGKAALLLLNDVFETAYDDLVKRHTMVEPRGQVEAMSFLESIVHLVTNPNSEARLHLAVQLFGELATANIGTRAYASVDQRAEALIESKRRCCKRLLDLFDPTVHPKYNLAAEYRSQITCMVLGVGVDLEFRDDLDLSTTLIRQLAQARAFRLRNIYGLLPEKQAHYGVQVALNCFYSYAQICDIIHEGRDFSTLTSWIPYRAIFPIAFSVLQDEFS
jgi:hypothetical protein